MSERQVPKKYQALYSRTQAKKAGPLQAIRMQCLECIGYVKDEIPLCTDTGCPLYQYRPYQMKVARVRTEVEKARDIKAGERLIKARQARAGAESGS